MLSHLIRKNSSFEDKIYAVNLYLDGKESRHRIAAMFDVGLASVQQWIRNYESMGADAFTLKGNKKYSKELKQQAVTTERKLFHKAKTRHCLATLQTMPYRNY